MATSLWERKPSAVTARKIQEGYQQAKKHTDPLRALGFGAYYAEAIAQTGRRNVDRGRFRPDGLPRVSLLEGALKSKLKFLRGKCRDLYLKAGVRSLPFWKARPRLVPESVLRWNDSCAVRVAKGIVEGTPSQGDLMILHDALLDAGCDDEFLLSCCREGAEWVAELLVVEAGGTLPEPPPKPRKKASPPSYNFHPFYRVLRRHGFGRVRNDRFSVDFRRHDRHRPIVYEGKRGHIIIRLELGKNPHRHDFAGQPPHWMDEIGTTDDGSSWGVTDDDNRRYFATPEELEEILMNLPVPRAALLEKE